MKNTRKLSLLLCALIALSLILSACGSSGNMAANDSFKSEAYYDSASGNGYELDMAPTESEKSDGTSSALDGRKIVKTVTVSAETKAFDDAIEHIRTTVSELGGYIENSNVKGTSLSSTTNIVRRTATFKLRIPADKLDEYVASVKEQVNVVSSREDIDDITDQYFDVDARLNSLKIEEERLLEMLAESTDLEYLIKLNERLSEVRYEIENYTSTIRRYDNMVSYSTVNITLEEVIDYTVVSDTPQSFGERLVIAFGESWHNFIAGLGDFTIGLVYSLPTLIILAVFIVIIVIVVKKLIKKAKKAILNEENKNDK